MAIIGKNVQLLSLPEGKKLEVKSEKINWSYEVSTKGKYSDFMIKEIHEHRL